MFFSSIVFFFCFSIWSRLWRWIGFDAVCKLRKLFDSIQNSNAENKWKFKHLNLVYEIGLHMRLLECWMIECIAISNVVLLAFQFTKYFVHMMKFIWIRYWTMDHNSPFTKCIANYPKVNRIKWDLLENIVQQPNNQSFNLIFVCWSCAIYNSIQFKCPFSVNSKSFKLTGWMTSKF